jgi:hypothetical protein
LLGSGFVKLKLKIGAIQRSHESRRNDLIGEAVNVWRPIPRASPWIGYAGCTAFAFHEIVAAIEEEVSMRCNFEKLWLYLNNELDLDTQSEVLAHLDHCRVCLEALYQMARDLDMDLFVPYELKDKLAS